MAKVTLEDCYYPDARPTVAYPECPHATIELNRVVCNHPARNIPKVIRYCSIRHMFPDRNDCIVAVCPF